jgi:hypothetical protein
VGRLNNLVSNARGAFEEFLNIKGYTAKSRFRRAYRASLSKMQSAGAKIAAEAGGTISRPVALKYRRLAAQDALMSVPRGLVRDWDLGPTIAGMGLGIVGTSVGLGTAGRIITGSGGLLYDRRGRRNIAGLPFI